MNVKVVVAVLRSTWAGRSLPGSLSSVKAFRIGFGRGAAARGGRADDACIFLKNMMMIDAPRGGGMIYFLKISLLD
eukprot:SAG31_NODE_4494_length_3187_cov_13.919365_6_plen_76_part_00